ncbi:MAG: NADH-quinone oxidoreductase subunit H, partial [Planctomycetota bacterium]|nr:NADH-quinone oxidoreductase subunit H [Planctomycetota bacterium]
LCVCFMMVVRWTVPRIRWDQVLKLAWNNLIPVGIVLVVATAFMVQAGWTALWQMLVMNVVIIGVAMLVQPLLPKSRMNEKLPLAGSRFSPLPGERVVTGPTSAEARDEQRPMKPGEQRREAVGV